MDVGVRELKAKLSEYLERASNGEVIRITDRGTPKARLMPLVGVDRVAQGIQEGWITPGVADGMPPDLGHAFQVRPGTSTEQVFLEDRGE